MNVLFIFLAVFVPFLYLVWRLIVYTRNTIGENSPFAIAKTYKGRLSRLDKLEVTFLVLQLCFFIGLIIIVLLAALDFDPFVGMACLVIVCLAIFILYQSIVFLVTIRDHWLNDRMYTITLLPEGRRVVLETQQISFSAEDVQSVTIVSNGHSRFNKSYYHFKLADANPFVISTTHPVMDVLVDFLRLKGDKYTYEQDFLPLIKHNGNWDFLRKIKHFFSRRYLMEGVGLAICLTGLLVLMFHYKDLKSWENSLVKEPVVIAQKEKYRAGKANAYDLIIDYKGKLYRHAVLASTYYRYPVGNKIELAFDPVSGNFYSNPLRDIVAIIVVLVTIAFFLIVRIIYLIVFPKIFH